MTDRIFLIVAKYTSDTYPNGADIGSLMAGSIKAENADAALALVRGPGYSHYVGELIGITEVGTAGGYMSGHLNWLRPIEVTEQVEASVEVDSYGKVRV